MSIIEYRNAPTTHKSLREKKAAVEIVESTPEPTPAPLAPVKPEIARAKHTPKPVPAPVPVVEKPVPTPTPVEADPLKIEMIPENSAEESAEIIL